MSNVEIQSYDLMIAEDDDDDYLIFALAVNEVRHSVKVSRLVDGEKLMKALLEHIPDILFLDLHMPRKDGHQCITEIRANQRYDNLPVIVYTSINDPWSIDRCYHARSNFFAVKPGSINELKNILEQILDRNWSELLYYPEKDKFVLQQSTDQN